MQSAIATRLTRVVICIATVVAVGAVVVPTAWADPPSAPAQPAVQGGDSQITVSFVAPDDGGSIITGFDASCVSSDGGVAGAASGTDSPLVVSALSNGNTYTCSVTATNGDGTGSPSPDSPAVVPSTVPAAPDQPAVAPANAQISVSFGAPDDGGSPITSYNADCSSSNGGASGSASGSGSPLLVTTLTNGKSYTCTVAATNLNGDGPASAASVAVTPSTVPGAPAQPVAASGNAQASVSFAAPADGGSAITGYSANCTSSNGGAAGSASGANSPIVVSKLTNGKLYSCTVTATNANGAGPPSPASAVVIPSTVPTAPAQPSVAPGDSQITVSFSAPNDGGSAITNYGATCTSSNGGSTGSAGGAGSPIVVTGLTNGKSYTCTVAATNANGAGASSPVSTAVVPSTVPSAPAQPTVGAGNGQISVDFVPPADGGSTITSYAATCTSSDGGAGGSTSGPSSPLVVTGLTNGKSYTCTVTATNANGDGPASVASAVVSPNRVPDAPAQPTVTPGNTQMSVSFGAPFDGGSPITSYEADCISSDGGVSGSASGSGSPLLVASLTNGKTYTCTVTATNANGDGAASVASAAAVPSTVPSAPAQPVAASGNAQASVSFSAPANGGSAITSYSVNCTSSNGGIAGSASGAGSPIVVTALTNGKSYSCTVTATNANGAGPASPASAVVIPSTVPAAPAQPSVAPGDSQVTVSFSAPNDGGSAITNYGATCISSNGGATGAASGAGSPVVVTGLSNGKSYTCTVAATNANGTGAASIASAAAIPSTVPAAPAQPSVVPGVARITVSFTAPGDGGSAITGYAASCTSSDGGTPGSASGAGSPLVVTSLTNGNTYTCTVAATNANGTGASSPASATAVPSTLPSAPAPPTVVPGNAQIAVGFTAPANGGSPITSYSATCASSNGGTLGSSSGPGSPVVVGGLTNGKSYTCTVSATNANGTGAASTASAAVIPSTVPSAPAQPGASATNAQITVTFTAPSDGGSAITGYTASCVSSNGGASGSASGGASPLVVSSLSNGKTYTCTVTATNTNGTGGPSPVSAPVVPSTVPSAPAQPTVASGNSQITVSFTAPNDGGSTITNYAVSCTSSNGGTEGSSNSAGSPVVVGGLSNGKSYTCTLSAANANGTSPVSPASAVVIPSTVPSAPAQPGVNAGNAQIAVAFTAPADGGSAITNYTASCTSSNGGVSGTANGAGSPLTVSGLTNGKLYTCTVTATNGNGPGAASPASATATPSTIPSTPAAPTVGAGNGQVSVIFSPPFDGGSAITGYNATCVSSNGGTPNALPGAGSPIIVTGLTNGKTYTCTLTATNANGTSASSPASTTVVPNRVPDPPAQPTVQPGNGLISVAFTAPFDGGSPVIGYTAGCVSSDGGASGSQGGAASPLVVSGLTNGKTYTCTVFASNANGDGAPSASSAAAVPSTIPSPPAQPGAVPGNAQVTVSFTAPNNGGSAITGYGASCTSSNGGTSGNASGAASPLVVTSLTNGKSYTCTVAATNANGTGAASPASLAVVPSTVPAAPAQPSVTSGNAQLTVSFTAPNNGGSAITDYGASCTSSNGGTAGAASGAASPIVVAGLTNGKSYTCTVTATNANGTGPASLASAAAIPSTVPSAPAAPTVTVGNGELTVAFTAPADGGSSITRYDATCVSSDGGVTGTNSGASSPIAVGALSNAKTYTCSVTATNVNGTGPGSPASSSAVPSTVPSAPQQPTAGVGNGQLTVAFVPPFNGGSPITGYTASCTSSDGGAPGSVSGAGSPLVVTSLTNGNHYTCTVTATNVNGVSAPSVPSPDAVPNFVPDAPAAPSVAPGNARATVSFGAPADGGSTITSYSVTCKSSNGGTPGSLSGVGSPIVVSGLTNGKTYTCTVNATNATGTGPDSLPSVPFIPSTVPGRPAAPRVTAGNARIAVTFAAAPNGGSAITGYTVACASTNGGRPGQQKGTRSPLTVVGLTNGRTYHCAVTATNANGSGPASTASANVAPADPVAVERIKQTYGYRMFSQNGAVYTFGTSASYGSAAGKSRFPIVGMATTPDDRGYWLVATNGAVFSFGDAHFYGSTAAIRLTRAIVGMAATPTGHGYWLVASDGGMFSFGDAHFYGSTGAIRLNRPIVGMASTPTGRGYWMVASDGGMFSFGDARFFGSAAAAARGTSVVGMATTLSGHGYWIAAANGAVWAFGDAPCGNAPPKAGLRYPISGIASTPTGRGYWLSAGDGGVFTCGDAHFIGWPFQVILRAPIGGISR